MRVLNTNELVDVGGGVSEGGYNGGGSPAHEPGLIGVYGIGLIGGPALRIVRIIVKLL
jgi:hypothetical protein